MKRIVFALLLFGALTVIVVAALFPRGAEPTPLVKLKGQYAKKIKSSVDHSLFSQLKTRFAKPQDVTAACIGCHNGRHVEVLLSSHWNWERTEYVAGQGIRAIGKKNALNNFCIGVSGNEQSCNRCHIGYGYADATFDFKNPLNVDCLACHDNSGKYAKAAGGAGMPDPTVDLTEVAQHVGRPQRANCGTCHFFGGGGNNVKHGDLESALFDAPRIVDADQRTKVIDIRTPKAFGRFALPSSQNLALREFFGKDAVAVLSPRHVKKVIVGDTESQERSAYLLLEELGYENLAVLQGGFGAFEVVFLGASAPQVPNGRGAVDVARFREKARDGIRVMIASSKTAGPKTPKKDKKIAGGC
jgi:rhodanese-related sulfurtransferase